MSSLDWFLQFLPGWSIQTLVGNNSINLQSKSITFIPEPIGQLTNVIQLYLNSNKLSAIPDSIGNLTNMTYLHMSNNQLSSLPASIGKLTKMSTIYLENNQLSTLPESFGQLTNMTYIYIYNNQLLSLPESIGLLSKLSQLDLYSNHLQYLPESIGQLSNLTHMNLYNNQLLCLPESIGLLTNISHISLYDNQLSSLPESIGLLTKISQLDLSNNQISNLPGSIGSLTNLTMLYVHHNPISELPESITRLTELNQLQIESGGERFIQRAPFEIRGLPCWSNNGKWNNMAMTCSESIKRLELYKYHNENLSDISPFIEKWKSCCRIKIPFNRISSLPENITTLTALSDLNLANNMLTEFPEVLLKMTWITALNLAGNYFTKLPEGIIRLSKLSYLGLAESGGKVTIQRAPLGISALPCFNVNHELRALSFSEPGKYDHENITDIGPFIQDWSSFSRINLANNQISSLPDQLTTLTALSELNIANNNLSKFPHAVLHMTWLTSLNISGNIMSFLPQRITNLVGLSTLVVADTEGRVDIKRAPSGISNLPCFNTNTQLQGLSFFESSISLDPDDEDGVTYLFATPDRLQQRMVKDIPNWDSLIDEKLNGCKAPILISAPSEEKKPSDEACKNGVLCLLCLKIFNNPCALQCEHIFCTLCITNSILGSGLQTPFACPVCHKPSINNELVTENMIEAAEACRIASDAVVETVSNPESRAPKCKDSQCKGDATHYCKKCGYFCDKHVKAHNSVNSDHESFLSKMEPGLVPVYVKLLCPTHKDIEVEYFCTECPQTPFKCSKCHAEQHKEKAFKMHEYIEYRTEDKDKFRELLQEHLDKINGKIEKTTENLEIIEKERSKVSLNVGEMNIKAKQFIDDLEKLVKQLKSNILNQLKNLGREFDRELTYKYVELQADKSRLEVAQQLVSQAMKDFCEMKPSELQNIINLSNQVTSVCVEDIVLKKRRLNDKLPENLLTQLESLNRQLLIGASIEQPANQSILPDLTVARESFMDIVSDSDSKEFFGIDERNSEIVKFDQHQRVIQKVTPHLCIQGGLHSLQAASLSRNGVLAIADAFANTVTLYDRSSMNVGLVLRGCGDSREFLFHRPCDVAFDSNGRLYVVDSGNKRVVLFDENFAFFEVLKFTHLELGQDINTPRMVETGPRDECYIYDVGSNSVLVFDEKLKFVRPREADVTPEQVMADVE